MERIDQRTTSSENTHSAFKLQIEADKKSVEHLAMELETVEKWQACRRSEFIAHHEKQQKAQQLAKEKYKKYLALTNANMSRLSKTLKGMEKKLKEELKDQWSDNRFEEFKNGRNAVKAMIKTFSSKADGPPDSSRCTSTPPSPTPLPPQSPPKPPGAGPEDESLKGSQIGKEKQK